MLVKNRVALQTRSNKKITYPYKNKLSLTDCMTNANVETEYQIYSSVNQEARATSNFL